MSTRALRRAAERQALKLAVNASKVMTASANGESPLYEPAPIGFIDSPNEPISEARLAANRANSQLSTGPTSVAGKAISSLNAVKTGLTGRTVLLPSDDALAYQQHLHRQFTKYTPTTDDEKDLVQTIADTEWRLLRIAPLETSIYALGRRKLAAQFADEPDPANREALIQGEIFVTYRKELSNLALQERRLRSQRKADIAELEEIRRKRSQAEKDAVEKNLRDVNSVREMQLNADRQNLPFDPRAHGFEFSAEELNYYWTVALPLKKISGQYPNLNSVIATYRARHQEPQAA